MCQVLYEARDGTFYGGWLQPSERGDFDIGEVEKQGGWYMSRHTITEEEVLLLTLDGN